MCIICFYYIIIVKGPRNDELIELDKLKKKIVELSKRYIYVVANENEIGL